MNSIKIFDKIICENVPVINPLASSLCRVPFEGKDLILILVKVSFSTSL